MAKVERIGKAVVAAAGRIGAQGVGDGVCALRIEVFPFDGVGDLRDRLAWSGGEGVGGHEQHTGGEQRAEAGHGGLLGHRMDADPATIGQGAG
ncbi:hypothetical protein H1235_02030 [Pseudoxanthomonas sp. NC8]|nr:hypothetical protein H1235_02030 [Pseudoxanthomonas sp. NC8]